MLRSAAVLLLASIAFRLLLRATAVVATNPFPPHVLQTALKSTS